MAGAVPPRVPPKVALLLVRGFGVVLLLLGVFVTWTTAPDMLRRAKTLDALTGEARLIGWHERSEGTRHARYSTMCAKFEFKGTVYRFERCMLSLHDFALLNLHMQNGNLTRVLSNERDCRELGEAGNACHASRVEINGWRAGDLADLSVQRWRVLLVPVSLILMGAAILLFPKPVHLGGQASPRVMSIYAATFVGLMSLIGLAYLWTSAAPLIGDQWEWRTVSRPTIRMDALAASDGAPRVTLQVNKRSGGESEWVQYRFPGFDGRHGEINRYSGHRFIDFFDAFADTPSLQRIGFLHANERVETETPLARFTALRFAPWLKGAYRDCWFFDGSRDAGGIRGWICAPLRERLEASDFAVMLHGIRLSDR
jgi:hypothetical protein